MPKYDYKCDVCNHSYNEYRDASQPQIFTSCPVAGCTGNLVEVN